MIFNVSMIFYQYTYVLSETISFKTPLDFPSLLMTSPVDKHRTSKQLPKPRSDQM